MPLNPLHHSLVSLNLNTFFKFRYLLQDKNMYDVRISAPGQMMPEYGCGDWMWEWVLEIGFLVWASFSDLMEKQKTNKKKLCLVWNVYPLPAIWLKGESHRANGYFLPAPTPTSTETRELQDGKEPWRSGRIMSLFGDTGGIVLLSLPPNHGEECWENTDSWTPISENQIQVVWGVSIFKNPPGDSSAWSGLWMQKQPLHFTDETEANELSDAPRVLQVVWSRVGSRIRKLFSSPSHIQRNISIILSQVFFPLGPRIILIPNWDTLPSSTKIRQKLLVKTLNLEFLSWLRGNESD